MARKRSTTSSALVGTAADDSFTVTSSTTSIDGRSGADTAIFSADISHYTIAPSGTGSIITPTGGKGVSVTNVEVLKFAGGSQAYDATTGTFVPDARGWVIGTAGNDTIAVTTKMTAIDGAGGSNTAIFADPMSQYAITPVTAGLDVTNLATGQFVYVHNTVQSVKFNGGSEVYTPPAPGTNPPASDPPAPGTNPPASDPPASGTQARAASDFLDSFGVNTHLGAWIPVYENIDRVKSSLAYLGIDDVRENMQSSSHAQAAYDQVASAGIEFDFLIPSGSDLTTFKTLLDSFASRHPGALAAIEGPNEIDIQPFVGNGSSSLSNVAQFQHELYAAVNADPLLSNVPVYNLTLSQNTDANQSQLGDLSSAADYANLHAYVWSGTTPFTALQDYIARGQEVAPGKPTVFTEAGYHNVISEPMSGVSETVQAKYTLDTLLDAYKLGVEKTYLYELFDEVVDPTNLYANFGLFNNDGSPKLAATAIHNLTQLLQDAGGSSSFTPGSLDYSLSGLPASGNHLLLQESNGTFDLMLWNEANIWDSSAHKEIVAPAQDVLVDLGQAYQNVAVFDPLVGSAPIATYANAQQLNVTLTDHPLVIEVNGTATTDFHIV